MPPTQAHRGGPMGAKKGTATPFSGKVGGGKVAGKTVLNTRRRRIIRDNIRGITKPAIRRLARRGGVKRISADIYDEIRVALKRHLTEILEGATICVEHRKAKTVTINDVLFSLRRLGRPIWGFEDVSKTKLRT